MRNHSRACSTLLILWILCLWNATTCQAQITYHVSLDTAPLIGAADGPFAVDFQLIDGESIGDANNTAVFSQFQFDSGSPTGSPSLLGGATGDLSSTVTLNDSSFLSEFSQSFLPGANFGFNVLLTTNADASGLNDVLAFRILDGSGTALPTFGPSDELLSVDLGTAMVQAFGTRDNRLQPPLVTTAPEPGSLAMLIALIAGGSASLFRKRIRRS